MSKIKLLLFSLMAIPLLSGAELHFQGKTLPAAGQRSYGYWGICTLPQPVTIAPGMELVYEILVEKRSIWGQGGIDLTGGTVNNLRDNSAIRDGAKLTVRGWASKRDGWVERRFKLDPVAGKSFRNVDFMSGEIDRKEPGIYSAKVRNIRLEIPGKEPMKFVPSDRHAPDKFQHFEPTASLDSKPIQPHLEFSGRVITPDAAGKRTWGYWGIAGLAQPMTIEPGSVLVYQLFVVPGSLSSQGGVDLTGGTVNNLRDNRQIVDQRGRTVRNLGANPAGEWFERRFKLDPVAGKTFQYVDFFSSEMEKVPAGEYKIRVRDIRIERPGKEPIPLQPGGTPVKDRFSNLTTAASAASIPEAVLAPGALRLTSRSTVSGVHDFVIVAISSPGWGFTLPDKAFLSYEVKLQPDSVSPFAGINLMFDGQDLRYRYSRENEIITDVSALRGRWGRRRIDLARMAGRRIYEVYAVAGFHQMRPGNLGAEFRDIRIVDAAGNTLCDLTPGKNTLLYYPLLLHTKFVKDVKLEIPGAAGARFRPSRYLADTATELTGTLYLHNFDPAAARELHYSLKIGDRTPASGRLRLNPGETRKLPVKIGRLAAGDYKPEIQVNGRTIREFAVSIRSEAELKQRKRAWEKGGTALGIVPMTATGAGGIWNIPAMRELGGNYYQCRIDWAMLETSPGKFDCCWFLPYLEMARDCGVDVQLDFYSGYPAYSVPAAYRQYEMVLNDGSRHGGTGTPIAYWSPGFDSGLRAMEKFYTAGLKHPAVVAFNAWTGGSMDSYYGLLSGRERRKIMDYSPWAAEKFRAFVRDELKYSLEEVNRRYGLQLKNFNELALPQPRRGELDLRPIWNDFMRYRSWSVNRMQDRSSSAIRRLAPGAAIEYLYGGGLPAARQGNDYNQGLRNAMKHNGSIHHTAAPGAVDLMYLGALHRNFGVPFSIETAGTPASMPEHQWAMYELLREGAAGFTWISSPGLTYRPPASYAMGEYRQAFERLQAARPLAPAIALIAGTAQQKIDIFNENPEVRGALQNLRKIATHLEAAGYETDVFTDETPNVDFSKYALVIDPGSAALAPECADALANYVRSGGKLLALKSSGKYTPGVPEERFRLLTALKNPGKGSVRILENLPSLQKPGREHFRRLVSHFHDGVYPSELDVLITDFAGLSPRIQTGEDNIYLALRREGTRYFVILFNNSDRLRKFRYRAEIPSGRWFVYDLTRRTGREERGFTGECTAQLMPYEIIVEEWSSRPVEVPVYDAPLPRRRWTVPAGSISGYPLAEQFTPKGRTEEHPDFTALPVQIAPGAKFAPTVPGPGSYELRFALLDCDAPGLAVQVDGSRYELREQNRRGDFVLYSTGGTALRLTPGSTIQFRNSAPLKIVYCEIAPNFIPLPKLTVAPARPNPGRYDGPAFRAPLPEFSQVAGRTLTGEKGLFNLATPQANSGVTEIAWEVDSPKEQTTLFAVSADYGLRLALNGEEVFDSTTRYSRQAPYPREFLLTLRLKKGINRFVGRVASGSDGWRFWCEMMQL